MTKDLHVKSVCKSIRNINITIEKRAKDKDQQFAKE